jgi:hypothetical protein
MILPTASGSGPSNLISETIRLDHTTPNYEAKEHCGREVILPTQFFFAFSTVL